MQRAINRVLISVINNKKQLRSVCNFDQTVRYTSQQKSSIILGIETSCDDTGCAIVDNNGKILGEALNSQHIIHLK